MTNWHNKFGESGQRLWLLSLLAQTPVDPEAPDLGKEGSLKDAVDGLFRIGGEDGQALVVLDVIGADADGPEFSVQENVSLHELADRLFGSYGGDGQFLSVLRVLDPSEDPFGGFGDGNGTDDEHEGEPRPGPLAALRRFREAVHRLFGGSAEQGQPPTVLSLLVAPADKPHDSK